MIEGDGDGVGVTCGRVESSEIVASATSSERLEESTGHARDVHQWRLPCDLGRNWLNETRLCWSFMSDFMIKFSSINCYAMIFAVMCRGPRLTARYIQLNISFSQVVYQVGLTQLYQSTTSQHHAPNRILGLRLKGIIQMYKTHRNTKFRPHPEAAMYTIDHR